MFVIQYYLKAYASAGKITTFFALSKNAIAWCISISSINSPIRGRFESCFVKK